MSIYYATAAELSAETANGQQQVNLHYTPPLEMQGMIVVTNTLRLTGGQIITSNATRVKGSTAIWENLRQQIEVTLTEASNFSLGSMLSSVAACACPGVVTLFVVSGAAGAFYWYQRRQTQG